MSPRQAVTADQLLKIAEDVDGEPQIAKDAAACQERVRQRIEEEGQGDFFTAESVSFRHRESRTLTLSSLANAQLLNKLQQVQL